MARSDSIFYDGVDHLHITDLNGLQVPQRRQSVRVLRMGFRDWVAKPDERIALGRELAPDRVMIATALAAHSWRAATPAVRLDVFAKRKLADIGRI